MKTLLIILFLLASGISYGQEFYFDLRFEDALGNKDTIRIGYDSNATDEIDPEFGEVNLHYTPFHPEFEVRICPYYFKGDTVLMKKQIEKKRCNKSTYPLVQAIWIKCKHFPLKLSWDQVFGNDCVNKTFFTDWYPGGWFDAKMGGEQGPFFLKDDLSKEFSHLNKYGSGSQISYIDYRGDLLLVLYFAITSIDNWKLVTGIQEISELASFKIYPNPVSNMLYIESEEEIQAIFVRNGTGQIVAKASSSPVNISFLPKGVYFVEVKKTKFQQKGIMLKILKK